MVECKWASAWQSTVRGVCERSGTRLERKEKWAVTVTDHRYRHRYRCRSTAPKGDRRASVSKALFLNFSNPITRHDAQARARTPAYPQFMAILLKVACHTAYERDGVVVRDDKRSRHAPLAAATQEESGAFQLAAVMC
jgi:hypothetical protein